MSWLHECRHLQLPKYLHRKYSLCWETKDLAEVLFYLVCSHENISAAENISTPCKLDLELIRGYLGVKNLIFELLLRAILKLRFLLRYDVLLHLHGNVEMFSNSKNKSN